MYRKLTCCLLFVALFTVCVPVARADDPVPQDDTRALAVEELREILAGLQELEVARQEIAKLKELVAKGDERSKVMEGHIAVLEQLVNVLERIIKAQVASMETQYKIIEEWKAIAKQEVERREKAEARADRLQMYAWLGPIGLLIGLAAGAFMVGL